MKKVLVILFLIALVFNCQKVNAVVEAEICEFSKEYIEWSKLSDEEKAKTEVIPTICETDVKSAMINNITSNSFVRGNSKAKESFPAYYSLAAIGEVSPVRNQRTTGTCWAFTSNEMVESNLLKSRKIALDFSSRHLEYFQTRTFLDGTNTLGLNREPDSGGNFFMSSSYFKNNYGPILEKDMPFEDNMNLIKLSSIQNKTQAVDVNTTFVLSNGNNGCVDSVKTAIKSHLMNYGAVGSLINFLRPSNYYNDTTHSYYYDGNSAVNHAVTIVGWDDNYSASNFSSSKRPSSAGAWIVKNSYGTSFGHNGYFYVSYEDSRVCKALSGVYDSDFDFPDKVYTYDKHGYNTSFRLVDSPTSAYVATKFTKPTTTEYLTEITVGAYSYANIDLYVIPNNQTLSINNATSVGSVTIPYGGYATHKLTTPIALTDTNYAIIAKYTYLSTSGPAVSLKLDDSPWDVVTAAEGQSYVSVNGTTYTDLMKSLEGYQANAAITAGTVFESETVKTDITKKYEVHNNKTTEATIKVDTTNIPNNSNLTVKVLSVTGRTDKTTNFTIKNNTVTNNVANVKVSAKSTAPVGDYIVYISYNGNSTEVNLNVKKYNFVTSIVIDDAYIEVGQSLQLLPVVEPSNADNKTLKMTSKDTSIFTVNNSKITGVKEGTAKLTIEATDGSGIKKEINVTVTNLFKPNSEYKLDGNYIINVQSETEYDDVLSNFNKSGTDKITIYDQSNKKITSGIIGTGYKLKKETSTKTYNYIFVILGDSTGDGKINSGDLLAVRQHLLSMIVLENEYFKASDVDKNLKINSGDLLMIRQYLLGMIEIK